MIGVNAGLTTGGMKGGVADAADGFSGGTGIVEILAWGANTLAWGVDDIGYMQ